MAETEEKKDSGALIQIVNRLMRQTGVADRVGATPVLEQLEISPIPLDAVIPICMSITKASITDMKRRKNRIPLVYVFLESYLLANKGAKHFAGLFKDLAAEQLAGEVVESEDGREGD